MPAKRIVHAESVGVAKETDESYRKLSVVIGIYLQTHMDDCMNSFKQRPNADNFLELEDIMYAWQFWSGISVERKMDVTSALRPASVTNWPSMLRKMQSDDFGRS